MSLALDPADGTLWMGSQGTLGTFYRYTQSGVLLQTRVYSSLARQNTLGGEFPVTNSASVLPTPTPAATPTPTPTPTPVVPVTVSVSTSATQVTEGAKATYRIAAANTVTQAVTILYSMSGTATYGSDYTLSGVLGQATIPAGASFTTVTFTAIADHKSEVKEATTMTLLAAPAYNLARTKSATITIINAP
jgi:hypothetical protein